MFRVVGVTLVGSVLLAGACSSTDEPLPSGPDETACSDYQLNFCAFVLTCELTELTKDECLAQARSIVCASQEHARECADEFASASCSRFRLGCDLEEVADRTEAQAVCEAWLDAICEYESACGTPFETCRADTARDFPCRLAVSVFMDPDACYEALETAPCFASEIPECGRVVLFGDADQIE